MKYRTKFWHLLTGLLPILLCLVAVGWLLLAAQPASAAVSGPTTTGTNVCLQPLFSGTAPVTNANEVNCTANDIKIARAISVSPTTCIQGSTFTLTATFEVNVTANERYDAAFIFDIGGDDANNDGVLDRDGAREGFCSESILSNTGGPPQQNLDGDSCGDLNAGPAQQVTFTIPGVRCSDTDGDGFLNLPNCTSWHSNGSTVCSGFSTAGPETKSKCVCDDTFQVPVRVETGGLTVAKDASPLSLDEPGGEFTYSVTVTNTLQFTTVVLDRICDDRFGLIAKVASAPACPTGTEPNTITSTTCSVPQTLAPAASYPCTFKANVNGEPRSLTDTVTVFGHDQGTTNPRTGSDSATVSIADVPPAALVTKSLVGLACADVNYHVKVKSNDTVESLTLSALIDNTFNNIANPGPLGANVLSTTCLVPQTIVASGSYECDFTAHFCGGSHSDQVTATLDDNDPQNPAIQQLSNNLTVNVSATVGP